MNLGFLCCKCNQIFKDEDKHPDVMISLDNERMMALCQTCGETFINSGGQ